METQMNNGAYTKTIKTSEDKNEALKNFQNELDKNQAAFAKKALIKTLSIEPDLTVGDILEGLDENEERLGMSEIFSTLTIREIVSACGAYMKPGFTPPPSEVLEEEEPSAGLAFSDDDDVEAEDDFSDFSLEEENDEEELSLDDDEEIVEEELDLSTSEGKEAYKALILKTLKQKNCVSEETSMSSSEIRDVVGGEPDQARKALNELIDGGLVTFFGKARGTKYYLEK